MKTDSKTSRRPASARNQGKRRKAREMAMQMLYQRELGESTLEQIFAAFNPREYTYTPTDADTDEEPAPLKGEAAERAREAFAYARQLVEGIASNADQVDEMIRGHAENWRLERMAVIDRSILRLAIYEMLYETSVPKVVIVDEAIELAKRFGSEHSGRFVNGLLDGVLKSGDKLAAQ